MCMIWFIRTRDFTAAHVSKMAHFLAGGLLCAYLMPEGPGVAFGVTVMATVLKEVHDGLMGYDVDLTDAMAIVAGGMLSLLVHWLPRLWHVL